MCNVCHETAVLRLVRLPAAVAAAVRVPTYRVGALIGRPGARPSAVRATRRLLAGMSVIGRRWATVACHRRVSATHSASECGVARTESIHWTAPLSANEGRALTMRRTLPLGARSRKPCCPAMCEPRTAYRVYATRRKT